MQIIASCSTVYDIPWPTSFLSFVSDMRVFLVDIISITKGSRRELLTLVWGGGGPPPPPPLLFSVVIVCVCLCVRVCVSVLGLSASCAQPMTYYASMMVVLIGLKLALTLLLLGPYLWSKLRTSSVGHTRRLLADSSLVPRCCGPCACVTLCVHLWRGR